MLYLGGLYTTAVHLELILNLCAEAICAERGSSSYVRAVSLAAPLAFLLARPPSGESMFLLMVSALMLQ